jgi:glycosyltransferase involved in cell wall biosynthesis
MRRHPAQIVHLHHGAQLIRRLARLTGATGIVQHVHGLVSEPDHSPITHLTFPGADAVVASSKAVAESLIKAHAQVIYAGVETSFNSPMPPPADGPIRIGVLSRLVPLKRIDAVIEATAQLAASGIEIQTEICGEGPSEPALRELVDRLGIIGRVRFLGWRTDTQALLSKWHLLAMPSMYEGFPIAALEAMANGRAVLASRVGGLSELIDDGVTGTLIPAGDTDALVQSIRDLALDRPRLLKMGYEGWKRVHAHFSNDRMAQQTIALYDRLLKR